MYKTMRPWERAILWGSVLLLLGGCMVACVVVLWFYYPIIKEQANQKQDAYSEGLGSKSWESIQAAGKMKVGVSPDFAPFSFYNAAVQFDGFEPALMLEIGKKLGVAIEFYDYASEGLPAAVSRQQIDAGLATLNATSENQALADFSLAYYSNEDAVLARKGTNISNLIAMAQMAPYRVGVQAGSVYEALAMKYLVDTGRIPEASLLHYPELDDAVSDLLEEKIDLVYLGMDSARLYMMGGGLELIGVNLTSPAYAIAFMNGASELELRINQALQELEREGKLDELANRYLGMGPSEDLADLPRQKQVGAPTPIPPQPPACLDVAGLEADINLPSQPSETPIQLAAGQIFQKGWRIINNGTCSWTASYHLVFAFGDSAQARMGGQPTSLPGVIAMGQTVDVYTNLVAPTSPGVYRGYWNLVNAKNEAFGERFPVTIEVNPNLVATLPGNLTPGVTTIPPPNSGNPPSTNIYFSATPLNVLPGEPVTFIWDVDQPKEVYLYMLGQDYLAYPVEATGTRVETPTKSATYELRAIFQNNSMDYRQVHIEVKVSGEGAPAIYEFSISPAGQIIIGQCVTISWWVDARSSEVHLKRDTTEIWKTAMISSSYTDCPQNIGITNYTLEAVSPGGVSMRTVSLGVNEKPKPPPPTFTPIPTWTPVPVPSATATKTFTPTATSTSAPPAVIDFFNAEPAEVMVGECALLKWKTSGGSVVVTLWRSGKAILVGAPGEATAQDCYQRDGPVTYRLTAENASGQVEQRDIVVTVKP
jgi:ABC-type amino acid transport substrate-binding protein